MDPRSNTGFWGNAQLLEKALDSGTMGTGVNSLIPQVINKKIAELALSYRPIRNLVPHTPWASGTYDRRKRVAIHQARWVPDNQSAPEGASSYLGFQEALKIIQVKGGVSGFLMDATAELLDAYAMETVGATMGALNAEEWGILHANSVVDPLQWTGANQWMEKSTAGSNIPDGNIILGGGTKLIPDVLDQMLTVLMRKGVQPDPASSFYVMDPRGRDVISKTLQAGQRWWGQVTIKGGFVLETYRGIPVVWSSMMQPNIAWPGSTVSATDDTTTLLTGSGFDGSTYVRYLISAVTLNGETLPCGEVASAPVSAGHGIKLSWSLPSVSGYPTQYVKQFKIYRVTKTGSSPTTGTETLYTVIPGTVATVDSVGLGFQAVGDVIYWIDQNETTVSTTTYGANGSTVTGASYTPGYVPTGQGSGYSNNYLTADEQDIYLFTTSVPGSDGYTFEIPTRRPLGIFPLAPISDKKWFLILQYAANIVVPQYQVQARRFLFQTSTV